MAEEYVDINTDPLDSAAASYVSAASRIRGVGVDFGNILSTYATAFGNDESGKVVHQQFSSLSRGFLDSVQLLSKVVDGTGDGITMLARQYNLVEERNTRLASSSFGGSPHDGPTGGPNQPAPHGNGNGNGDSDGGGGRRRR